jgi:hypothetical protein
MPLLLPKSGSEFAVPFTADILDLMSEVTRILGAIEQGELHAAEHLLPPVYDELRRLAAAQLAREKPGQTLDATALVHEAYLRKVGSADDHCWQVSVHGSRVTSTLLR